MSLRASIAIPCLTLSLGVGCGWKLETREATPQAESPAAETGRASAPAFALPSDDGTVVSLDELLADGKPAVLVFYRGHW